MTTLNEVGLILISNSQKSDCLEWHLVHGTSTDYALAVFLANYVIVEELLNA